MSLDSTIYGCAKEAGSLTVLFKDGEEVGVVAGRSLQSRAIPPLAPPGVGVVLRVHISDVHFHASNV